MRYILAALLLFGSLASSASEIYPNVESFLKQITGGHLEKYVVEVSDSPRTEISNIFGIIYDKDSSERSGLIFGLARINEGGYRLIAESNRFDYSDPSDRSYVEMVEANTNDLFSIKFFVRHQCGIHVRILRFKEIQNRWRVIGMDSSPPDCGNEIVNAYSANFLTGQIIVQKLKNNKKISTKITHRKFPVFLLSGFSLYNDKYE